MSPPDPRLSYLVGRLDRIVRRDFVGALGDAGLTLAQYTALSVLAARPGLSNAQLARRSLVTPQAMNQALANLTDRGLITRRPHPTKGRVLSVELTPSGHDTLALLDRAVDEVEDRLLSPLTAIQRAQLLDSLRRLTGVDHT
jgi:DNA-binding MarR family transcriptional regulator